MLDGFETREMWPYECLRCLYVWEEEFVVRRLCDAYGKRAEIWLSAGVPVQPPWAGSSCPSCGAHHLTSFPSGYLARHPELVAEPEPGPAPVFAPAPVSWPDSAPAARRSKLPGRLLIAFGVPLVLFLGYELYIIAAAHAGH
ncbi:hypothetical protein E1286_20790 [Nonomuraea terrae]|uniref:Uncharacterized protein n=1 Tax=Nonomuraea terrae TaxID=2530383 RepID=A0A4R4YS79_9ACTN|nr:hypothetical protein [Nonomuraea terrae]TDD46422.1 hypothetical protein E1286_20790 [Nonomuraea terrae]